MNTEEERVLGYAEVPPCETLRLEVTEENLKRAGEILRRGGLVAFPTETVYGLGADALNEEAVRSVYRAKGRPSDNPMIVHIASRKDLEGLVREVGEDAKRAMDAFWPGPLTIILPRSKQVPDTTTGGLDTVGIRMPGNETARRLIRAAGCPVAAPSANLSGKPSPTTACDVLEDMDGRIDAVLLGEDCAVGIESTVVDMTGETPIILRPGYVTKEMLEEALGKEVRYDQALFQQPSGEDFHPRSPGMKYRHYAPKAEVCLYEGEDLEAVRRAMAEAAKRAEDEGRRVFLLDYGTDSRAAAHDFFARLRELDREGYDLILVSGLERESFGLSVMNRMTKAAGYEIVQVDGE